MLVLDKNYLTLNPAFTFDDWISLCNSDGSAVLINKDKGWTSFDVIAKIRKIIGIRKIGHCGTLDPFATGLLILCIGKSTKQVATFQELSKQYLTRIKLGATTKSHDTETEEENFCDVSNLSVNTIQNALHSFIGNIEQIPPMYSAKKIDGKKLYQLARKNIEITRNPTQVSIENIEIIDINLPFVDVRIKCSKGTYIRSLARDVGEKLGVGGYLTELVRLRIGDYDVEYSFKLEDIVSFSKMI